MAWVLLLPVYLGIAAVVQGVLNRHLAQQWGLAGAVLLSGALLTLAAGVFFVLTKISPSTFPEVFRDRGAFLDFSWWYLLPGLLGFTLVAGIPFGIHKIGALGLFIGLIAAQIVSSMIWDATFENRPVTLLRVAGSLITFLGAAIATWGG